MSDTWTPDRVNTLHAMIADGRSAGQIAAALSITRGAVMGRVHRNKLRLAGKAVGGRPTKPAPPAAESRTRIRFRPAPIPTTPACTAIELLFVRFVDLKSRDCRWPLDSKDEFGLPLFCGRPTVAPGCPWCPAHFRMVYRQDEPR